MCGAQMAALAANEVVKAVYFEQAQALMSMHNQLSRAQQRSLNTIVNMNTNLQSYNYIIAIELQSYHSTCVLDYRRVDNE